MITALLGLGGNVGDVLANLQAACRAMVGDEVNLVDCSAVYESEPWGKTDQPRFLNLVLEVETSLSPRALLQRCLEVEKGLGRVRAERWGPRTVDIDILLYGDRVIDEPGLQVPHPRLHLRSFALLPLLQLKPTATWPGGKAEGDVPPIKGQPLASFAPALIRSQPLTPVMPRRTFLDTLFR
jgi:2-amino-4-hydroxy-6-hydroxymethyldihydropteridine diphosphokinase